MFMKFEITFRFFKKELFMIHNKKKIYVTLFFILVRFQKI